MKAALKIELKPIGIETFLKRNRSLHFLIQDLLKIDILKEGMRFDFLASFQIAEPIFRLLVEQTSKQ